MSNFLENLARRALGDVSPTTVQPAPSEIMAAKLEGLSAPAPRPVDSPSVTAAIVQRQVVSAASPAAPTPRPTVSRGVPAVPADTVRAPAPSFPVSIGSQPGVESTAAPVRQEFAAKAAPAPEDAPMETTLATPTPAESKPEIIPETQPVQQDEPSAAELMEPAKVMPTQPAYKEVRLIIPAPPELKPPPLSTSPRERAQTKTLLAVPQAFTAPAEQKAQDAADESVVSARQGAASEERNQGEPTVIAETRSSVRVPEDKPELHARVTTNAKAAPRSAPGSGPPVIKIGTVEVRVSSPPPAMPMPAAPPEGFDSYSNVRNYIFSDEI